MANSLTFICAMFYPLIQTIRNVGYRFNMEILNANIAQQQAKLPRERFTNQLPVLTAQSS